MALQEPSNETVRGTQTTEFWTMLFTNAAGVIQLLAGPVDVSNRYVAIGIAIVNGLYAVGRGLAKQGVAP